MSSRMKMMFVCSLAIASLVVYVYLSGGDGSLERHEDAATATRLREDAVTGAVPAELKIVAKRAELGPVHPVASKGVKPSGSAEIAIQRLKEEGVWIPDDFVLATEGEIVAFVEDVRALQKHVRENYAKRMRAGTALVERLYAEGKYIPDLTRNYPEQTHERSRKGLPELRPWIAKRRDDFVYAKFFKNDLGEQVVHYLRIQPGQSSDYDSANYRWNRYRQARDAVVLSYMVRYQSLKKSK